MSPIFFHLFAKNSLIKHILEVEKRFDSGTCEYFGQGEDFKPTTKLTVRKSAIFPQPDNQKRRKSNNTAYVNKKPLFQDEILRLSTK